MSEDVEKIYNEFAEKGYTDGLPIIPPTRARVNRMLEFTDRKNDDVIGKVPPSEYEATVEAIASNAVMAGCKPEYFPVVLEAIHGALDRPNLRGALATTGPCWPMTIADGPIAKEIGMYSSWGGIGTGPQHRANVTIGRTVTLCMQNIGKSVPGQTEKKPFFNIWRYGMCFAEAEDLIPAPWQPLSVDKGVPKGTSAVSVIGEGNLDSAGGGGRPSGDFLMDNLSFARNMNRTHNNPPHGVAVNADAIIIFTPGQARVYTDNGWSKKDLQEFLFDNCRSDPKDWYKDYPADKREDILRTAFAPAPKWMPSSDLVPLFESPQSINIVIAGGDPPRTFIHYPTAHCNDPLVTKPILFSDGTPVKSVYDFKKRK
ncbi:hypothetical protein MUP77_22650 [Candidatus Bathyarchaeota archaeon]|nr:hypothetical protein [Candidatus Bathyarchaeota archaeon]